MNRIKGFLITALTLWGSTAYAGSMDPQEFICTYKDGIAKIVIIDDQQLYFTTTIGSPYSDLVVNYERNSSIKFAFVTVAYFHEVEILYLAGPNFVIEKSIRRSDNHVYTSRGNCHSLEEVEQFLQSQPK